MPRANVDPNRCKHRVVGTGKRCKGRKTVDDTGYCDLHRHLHRQTGATTPEGKAYVAKNHIRMGIYAHGFTADERRELAESNPESMLSLDGEVMLAKAQLRRVWIAAGKAIGAENPEEGLELLEQRQFLVTTSEAGADGVLRDTYMQRRAEVVKRAPDFAALIDRAVRTVARLVESQAGLAISGKAGLGAGSVAAAMRQAAVELRRWELESKG